MREGCGLAAVALFLLLVDGLCTLPLSSLFRSQLGERMERTFKMPRSNSLLSAYDSADGLPCSSAMWRTLERDFAAVDRMSPTGRANITAQGVEGVHRNFSRGIDWLRIYDGKVYHMGLARKGSVTTRCSCMAIQKMQTMGLSVPDGDFPFMDPDGPYCFPSVPCAVPIISHTARRGVDYAVRTSWAGFYSIDQSPWLTLDKIPFEQKKNLALWRGRLTGLGDNIDKIGKEKELKIDSFTRYHLVKEAESRKTLLDAKFIHNAYTFGNDIAPGQREIFFRTFGYGTANHKKRVDQAQYQMTVVVDGNYGQGRLAYQMGMKTVILRLKTNWPDTYEEWMVPYEHYVPVDNLEDLWAKIKWLQSNVTEAERIATNGMNFAHKCLTAETFIRYFHRVLVEYAARQEKTSPPPRNVSPIAPGDCTCPDFFNGW